MADEPRNTSLLADNSQQRGIPDDRPLFLLLRRPHSVLVVEIIVLPRRVVRLGARNGRLVSGWQQRLPLRSRCEPSRGREDRLVKNGTGGGTRHDTNRKSFPTGKYAR